MSQIVEKVQSVCVLGRAENAKALKIILGRVDLVVIHKKWPGGAFDTAFYCFGE